MSNPIVDKDAAGLLRLRPLASLLLVTSLPALGLALATSAGQELETLARWGSAEPRGRTLLLALTTTVLYAQCLVVPVMAAVAIAGERERGTFGVLLTTALSPWQIVKGKLGAQLAAVSPVLFVLAPILAAAGLWGDVGAGGLSLAVLALAGNGLALAAVGLLASAWASSTKSAILLALALAAVLVLLPVTTPLSASLWAWDEGGLDAAALPLAVGVGLTVVTVTALALYGAWTRIGPAGMARGRSRLALSAWLSAGVPTLLALTALWSGASAERDGIRGFAFVGVVGFVAAVFLLVFAVAFEVTAARRKPRPEVGDGPPPLRAMGRALGPVLLGQLLVVPLAAGAGADIVFSARNSFPSGPHVWTTHSFGELIGPFALGGLLVLIFAAGVAGLCALLVLLLKPPYARVAAAVALVFLLAVLPGVGGAAAETFGLGGWEWLFFFHPLAMAASVGESFQLFGGGPEPELYVAGAPWWLAGALVWAALAAGGALLSVRSRNGPLRRV